MHVYLFTIRLHNWSISFSICKYQCINMLNLLNIYKITAFCLSFNFHLTFIGECMVIVCEPEEILDDLFKIN